MNDAVNIDFVNGVQVANDNLIVIDFETRSTANLEHVGHAVYAANPNTDVTCGAFTRGAAEIELWKRGDPVPPPIFEVSADASALFGAHNAEFEIAIWRHILTPRYGWPECPPAERWRCSMALARAQALPADLDLLMRAAGFRHRKADSRVIKILSAPRPPRDNEPEDGGPYWHTESADSELFEQLYAYVRNDVACEREAFELLPPLTPHEQLIWCLHCQIGFRGFFTDGTQIEQAITVIEAGKPAVKAEIAAVTGGAVQTGNQFAKIREQLARWGCELPNIKKKTVKAALTRPDLRPEVRRLLELRREAAFASAHKFAAMQAWRGPDGRIRGALKFHGAATGRWSGTGPQPQNLRREDNE
jgi:DNA polymerase